MPPEKQDNILPADFDGVFKFTNASDRDFSAKWNKIEYTFKAMSTSPMVISNATPEEVQHIRKKFAREYAEREFYRSGKFKDLDAKSPAGSGNSPAPYSETDLEPYIQRCLEPLPEARTTAKRIQGDKTENYHTDVTKVLDKDALESRTSLTPEGSAILAG